MDEETGMRGVLSGAGRTGFLAACLWVLLAPGAGAQEGRDSTKLHREAKKVQEAFEGYRVSNTPATLPPLDWDLCDIIVGTFCVEHEDDFPRIPWEEPVNVELARTEFLTELAGIHQQIPGDWWVLGVLILYLGEEGRWSDAHRLAQGCQAPRPGWCDALQGLTLHRLGQFPEAQEAYQRALAALDPKRVEAWTSLRMVTDNRGDGVRRGWDGEAADTMTAWVWHLSDPLYLVEGNDRWTEHLARWTEDEIREDAASPWERPWNFDLQELLIRFGPSVEWARVKYPAFGYSLESRTSMRSREKAHMRQFVPPGRFLEDPTGIPWGAWDLEVKAPHVAYAPDYAPVFRPLDWQMARFRRGDSLRVVAAYAPGPGTAGSREEVLALQGSGRASPFPGGGGDDGLGNPGQARPTDPFRRPPPAQTPPGGFDPRTRARGPRIAESAPPENRDPATLIQPPPGPFAEAALILSPGPGREPFRFDGAEGAAEGVYDVTLPNGRYVASLEIFDEVEARAWRARQGLRQNDLVPGLAEISDILLVKDVEELPETLEEAIPDALPGHAIPRGGSVIAAWEVYGIRPGERTAVNVSVSEAEGDFFQSLGELLRLSEPEEPVVMTWEEGGPQGMQAFFRSVRLTLPNLEPGRYLLSIEVVLPGRDPMVRSTPLVVE